MTYGTGSITRTASGKWRVRIPDGRGGKRTIGTFPTPEEAERMRAAALLGALEVDLGITFEDFSTRWLNRCELEGQASIGSSRSLWRTTISQAPWYGEPLAAITRVQIREWAAGLRTTVTTRGTEMSRQQAKHALGHVRRCFEAARTDEQLIEDNPADGIGLWREARTEDPWTYLTEEEIDRLLCCPVLPPMQLAVYTVAIGAGLREGELAGLRWPDVHLEQRPRLDVRRSWGGATKAGKPRMVPLLPWVQDALRAWHAVEGAPEDGPVFPSRYRRGEVRHFAKGYDFAWANHPADRYTRLGWRTRAGIARPVRFHDLRHTCASHLIMGTWGRAWALHEVRDLLGHTDVEVTQRYAHLAPDALLGAAAATVQQDRNRTDQLATEVAQLAEIIGRAMGDSNPRPSAPEFSDQRVIPGGCPPSGPESVLSAAEALLRDVAAGRTVQRERLLELARAVLEQPEVRLAGDVISGGGNLALGVRLAAAVIEGARVRAQEATR